MLHCYEFSDIARIPTPGDNVAIAIKRLDAGTRIAYNGTQLALTDTVLEGHRFAVASIVAGEPLFSWGLPFGIAVSTIEPGAYVCNAGILDALSTRNIDFELPPEPNFRDVLERYMLDESSVWPGVQVPRYAEERSFAGYRRATARGVGTRNYIVILGSSSRVSGYAKALEERLMGLAERYEHIDGIVAVAHTEGGGYSRPNNLELVLRALAGFVVHPNVGAVLAVDYGDEAVNNELLQRYLIEHGYPLGDVPHQFLTISDGFQSSLDHGASIVGGWLDQVNSTPRTVESLAHLKVALQCGGSDAFSGVSGNPLAAWVAKEIIRYGGSANLAETDELIGAEHYVLQNVKDVGTARAFLRMVEQFKERLSWHGHTAEGNPSGGNKFRGLYNIAIKSIGAAMKRHPDVRLDDVIDYGERMGLPGYYFMNSPGNDLESIAGQVASGCNIIFFITGNGSITNFPFVPTIKIVTTTGRYNLLSHEMDVNAGAYLDGVPMDELGGRTLDFTVEAASGRRTSGEKAAHSQVSIWRNWMQKDSSGLVLLEQAPIPSGQPLLAQDSQSRPDLTFIAIKTPRGYVTDQLGLVMPTSLCAGQIGKKIADRLNRQAIGRDKLSRTVALPHTEGCGSSGGASEILYTRTVIGHLTNPLVSVALLLEHGCEKTHNDYFRSVLRQRGIDANRFGWASIQLDGGIDRVTQKAEDWFATAVAELPERIYETVALGCLRIALSSIGPVTSDLAQALGQLTRSIVGAGGTVVIPEKATILSSSAYLNEVLAGRPVETTLAYGQAAAIPGLHVMEAPTDHWIEAATGLAATGVEIMLVHTAGRPVQGHRLVPVLLATADTATQMRFGVDLDLCLTGDSSTWADDMLETIAHVASRMYTPKVLGHANADIQFTRGPLGVSL